ncbi:MAG TPA: right-handed parallel beta-helix repeat-containing protein [Pyrinomonadaceae bacterium]|nr:right-handed parallel beta-helix repeat-containing protein [Pyrinomonadaceae bacterium]
MIKFYPTIKALLVTSFILALATAAQAQATRTWVSGVGDDVNPCSRTAPCKTFAGAISKTAKDGEISVLDPGGYGAVTITKSIYINGTHGAGYGSIIASLVNGIIINITDVNDVRKAVRLRALDINGASTGINGISLLAANNVFVEDCVIDGFTGNGTTSGIGIRMALTATSGSLFVSDTMIHKTVTGIRATTTSGFAVASVRNCNIENNTTGVEAATNGFVTVADSRIAANTGSGLTASASGAQLNARDNIINNNGTAINAAAGSSVRAMSNLLLNNTTGFGGTTSVISSDGQNRNAGNTTPGTPTGPGITVH